MWPLRLGRFCFRRESTSSEGGVEAAIKAAREIPCTLALALVETKKKKRL
jgi:hypothetical protein